MTHTRLERDVRRLNQRIAMLEIQLNQNECNAERSQKT
jgi:hypothetical protein